MTTSPAKLIRGLFEAHLHVADLERAMKFYGDTLGLELGDELRIAARAHRLRDAVPATPVGNGRGGGRDGRDGWSRAGRLGRLGRRGRSGRD